MMEKLRSFRFRGLNALTTDNGLVVRGVNFQKNKKVDTLIPFASKRLLFMFYLFFSPELKTAAH